MDRQRELNEERWEEYRGGLNLLVQQKVSYVKLINAFYGRNMRSCSWIKELVDASNIKLASRHYYYLFRDRH